MLVGRRFWWVWLLIPIIGSFAPSRAACSPISMSAVLDIRKSSDFVIIRPTKNANYTIFLKLSEGFYDDFPCYRSLAAYRAEACRTRRFPLSLDVAVSEAGAKSALVSASDDGSPGGVFDNSGYKRPLATVWLTQGKEYEVRVENVRNESSQSRAFLSAEIPPSDALGVLIDFGFVGIFGTLALICVVVSMFLVRVNRH